MTQEVINTTAQLPTEMPTNVAWGAGENVRAENILIPKILLMQAISEFVMENHNGIKMGDFVDSVEKVKIAAHNEPIELIIFHTFDTWVNHLDGEFFSTERVTSANANLPREEETKEGIIARDYCQNFYALRIADLKEGLAFPYVISFKRTSRNTGKALSTRFTKMLRLKKSSASVVVKLSAKLEKGDKGHYYVSQVEFGRETTKEEMQECYAWYRKVVEAEKAGRVQVDEEAEKANGDSQEVNAEMGAESRF